MQLMPGLLVSREASDLLNPTPPTFWKFPEGPKGKGQPDIGGGEMMFQKAAAMAKKTCLLGLSDVTP